MKIYSNVVKKEPLRIVQKCTLDHLGSTLKNSFGPMGSNTELYDPNRLNQYTKDGHTILKSIQYHNVIEKAVKADLEDITLHIVNNVGDGTTSAILLANAMFNHLSGIENEEKISPYIIIERLKNAIKDIQNEIKSNKKEFNAEEAYNIAMISSNGNKQVADIVKNVYTAYGNDVFIDVGTNNGKDTLIKEYDGMTLNAGYSETAYINDVNKGTAVIRDARIYEFEDPIDTPEQMALLARILDKNIMGAYTKNNPNPEIHPTVILAPRIGRDMGSFLGNIVEFMYKFKNPAQKPPLLIVTNIYDTDQFYDICRLCGCKPIKKYINIEQQEKDIENGLAPTLKNVHEFYGTAELVESSVSKTKFIRPQEMFKEDGETKSDAFNTLLNFLEAELKKSYEENATATNIGSLKRRLHSLKANMVEILIGGVSASDRDNLRDLVEDTILNCRSASENGIGFAANFEALRASYKLKDKSEIHKLLFESYFDLVSTLYSSVYTNSKEIVEDMIEKNIPINIRTKQFDEKVICSIKTDIVILEALSNILTLMLTSNQFITPTPVDNVYSKIEE